MSLRRPRGRRPAGSEQTFHQWLGDGAYCLSASYGGGELGEGSDVLALCYSDPTPGGENAGYEGDSEVLCRGGQGACGIDLFGPSSPLFLPPPPPPCDGRCGGRRRCVA